MKVYKKSVFLQLNIIQNQINGNLKLKIMILNTLNTSDRPDNSTELLGANIKPASYSSPEVLPFQLSIKVPHGRKTTCIQETLVALPQSKLNEKALRLLQY